MQLFLHIEITKDPVIFSVGNLPPVKEWLPQVTIFDLDNFSDSVTISTAIKAMNSAEKICLSIHAVPGAVLGSTMKIMNQLMKITSPVIIHYIGEHEIVDKIIFRFKDKRIVTTELESALKDFFNPSR